MMYTIKLTQEGKDTLYGVLPSMERKFQGGIRAAIYQAGQLLVKTAKDGIQRQAKNGRVYVRNGKRKKASAAGQYPGILTGQTLRGIDFEVKGTTQLEFGIREREKGPKNLPRWLEGGTSRMKARPTLNNAHKARQGEIYNYLQRLPIDRIQK